MMIDSILTSAHAIQDGLYILAQANPGETPVPVYNGNLPGQNLNPQAPAAFSSKADRALNFGQWLALLVGVCGVLAFGAGMFFSRSQGGSEEQVKQAIGIGVGALIVSSAGGLLATLVV